MNVFVDMFNQAAHASEPLAREPLRRSCMYALRVYSVRPTSLLLVLFSRSVCLHTRGFSGTLAIALSGSFTVPVAEP
jgi:hypothetical protein